MPRPGVTAAMVTALQSPSLKPALFVSIQFKTETVYLWTGSGSLTWNGQTWSGAGSLMNISSIETSDKVEAQGMSIELSGIDPTLLSEVLSDVQIGYPVSVYFTAYSGSAFITPPITSWNGRVDRPTCKVGGDQATISLACETQLIDMNIPVDRRYTQEDQQNGAFWA